MKDLIRQVEANIRHLQCLLADMLLWTQVLDIRLAEMAGTKVRPLSHTQRDVGVLPTPATTK